MLIAVLIRAVAVHVAFLEEMSFIKGMSQISLPPVAKDSKNLPYH